MQTRRPAMLILTAAWLVVAWCTVGSVHLAAGCFCEEPAEFLDVVIGVDLGGTSMVVAAWTNGSVVIIPDADGRKVIPINDGIRQLGFGEEARRLQALDYLYEQYHEPSMPKTFLQNLVYTFHTRVAAVRSIFSPDPGSNAAADLVTLLARAKEMAESYLGGDVRGVVATVPYVYADRHRTALKTAFSLAGLEVVRIINEPMAAALAHRLDTVSKEEVNAVVIHLGGTRWSVASLTIDDGVFEVLATVSGLHAEHTSPEKNNLDKLAHKIARALDQAIKDGGLVRENISLVVVEGGLSRSALLVRTINDYFNGSGAQLLATDFEPDEVVARGAALMGHQLKQPHRVVLLCDFLDLSLGLETADGYVEYLLLRNTPIPARAKRTFITGVNETGARLSVVQGVRPQRFRTHPVTELLLKGLVLDESGQARVEVTFELDVNSILHITAQQAEGAKKGVKSIRDSQAPAKKAVSVELWYLADATELVQEAYEFAHHDAAYWGDRLRSSDSDTNESPLPTLPGLCRQCRCLPDDDEFFPKQL